MRASWVPTQWCFNLFTACRCMAYLKTQLKSELSPRTSWCTKWVGCFCGHLISFYLITEHQQVSVHLKFWWSTVVFPFFYIWHFQEWSGAACKHLLFNDLHFVQGCRLTHKKQTTFSDHVSDLECTMAYQTNLWQCYGQPEGCCHAECMYVSAACIT